MFMLKLIFVIIDIFILSTDFASTENISSDVATTSTTNNITSSVATPTISKPYIDNITILRLTNQNYPIFKKDIENIITNDTCDATTTSTNSITSLVMTTTISKPDIDNITTINLTNQNYPISKDVVKNITTTNNICNITTTFKADTENNTLSNGIYEKIEDRITLKYVFTNLTTTLKTNIKNFMYLDIFSPNVCVLLRDFIVTVIVIIVLQLILETRKFSPKRSNRSIVIRRAGFNDLTIRPIIVRLKKY